MTLQPLFSGGARGPQGERGKGSVRVGQIGWPKGRAERREERNGPYGGSEIEGRRAKGREW